LVALVKMAERKQKPRLPRFFLDTLRREFVIDEKPQPVLRLPRTGREGRVSLDRPGQEVRWDFYSQMSHLILEQDRLRALTEELRSRGESTVGENLERLFRQALPLMDSFDRIIISAQRQPPTEELQNWLKTISSMQARLIGLYEKFGLRTMDPVGKKVNLDRHEVVEVLHTDGLPDETVVEVRQKGYIYNNKIIRDAQVVVAQNQGR